MKAKPFFFILVITIVFLFSYLPANGQTIHAIIVTDTNDPNIGNGVKSDLSNMTTFLQNAANATGMRLNLKRIFGADCNNANAVRAINELQSQPDDIVVFYYSGHGHRWDTTKGKWPLLSLNRELPFSWVIQKMEEKGAKGSLVITDSCNVSLGGGFGLTGPEIQPASRSTYINLFRNFAGRVRVSSSSVGEYSYGPDTGGVFTNTLLNVISENPSSWNEALEKTKTRVVSAMRRRNLVETPQFELASEPTEVANATEAIITVKWYLPHACGDGGPCSYYFNICNNAATNISPNSPGTCKVINIANEKVQGASGTRRNSLQKGGDYRITITGDNVPGIGAGRWAAVKTLFNLQSGQTITFTREDFRFWRTNP